MLRNKAVLFAASIMCAALGASAALSQQTEPPPPAGKACLQANRMQNYDVLDDRTLVITDRFFKRYTVRMASGCVGLTRAAMNVVLQARTALGCFGDAGDKVAFNSPGLGPVSCFVTSVENYVPPLPKGPS